MQQSIRYKGLSLTPDEMAVENGALSLCGNLELHDGALRPAIVAGTSLASALYIGNSANIATLLYIHETGSYKHLIGIRTESRVSTLYWFDSDGSYMNSIYTFSSGVSILSVNSVGNTLIITATDGIHYAIFHPGGSGNGSYQWLGQKPPFLEISFNTNYPSGAKDYPEDYPSGGIDTKGSKYGFIEAWQQTNISCDDAYTKLDGDTWNPGEICANIKEDKQSDLTQSIYALVNRTNNIIARNGRFYANFFIRYCYRMFDGTMIMHSAPVFIPVQVPDSYMVQAANFYFPKGAITEGSSVINSAINYSNKDTFDRKDAKNNILPVTFNNASFYYYPRNVSLRYFMLEDANIEELKKWSDVIKSIDFFITPPITNVDTSEKINSLQIVPYNCSLGIGERKCFYTNTEKRIGYVTVKFPTLADDVYKKRLKNTSSYFKVCSININELKSVSGVELPVDKNAVYQISLQEQMKDDYKSHNILYAKGSYVYNHRLNLYGVKERLFAGFNDNVLLPQAEFLFGTKKTADPYLRISKIVVRLNTTSGIKYVEKAGKYQTVYTQRSLICNASKFYPDSRADKMVMWTYDEYGNQFILGFDLTPCDELNGAIHMGTFKTDVSEYIISSFSYTADDVVDLSNKLYTSEADNPFHFPLNAINTVGIGTIQGIASTTRALSQGQFGQYPLMAFSTDGIWALDVSSTGTYSSIRPISREVCSNPASITQLDQSVAFVTNRSLSRIVESQIVSMTDVLDGPYFNISANLGKLANYFKEEETDVEDTKDMKSQMRQLINFSEPPIDFFQHCKVIYDYKNSRILCLDVSKKSLEATADTVAFSYSVRDQAWSTFIIKNVLTAINSYPHPYIQYRDGSVMCLDQGYNYSDPDETEYAGILVSRTLKFDEDNVPNAITGFIHSLTTDVKPVMWLYGSNDNQHWHYLGRTNAPKSHYMSSHSFRYFRIALYLWLESKDQYFATRLEVIRRFNKF